MEQSDPDSPLAPRRNPDLFGHEAAEAQLVAWFRSGRPPHGLIIGGPQGIGKATLAFRLARWLLAGGAAMAAADEGPSLFGAAAPAPAVPTLAVDPGDPVARRVASSGHADLMTIERGWDPRRKRRRAEITVDEIREVARFLHLTPAEGGFRVVIVDAADDMNRNAGNAVLKILEEPPKAALLILVCHAPGRLLPTIRSRCRLLKLQPLATDQVETLLAMHEPALAADDQAALAFLAEGSIGRALDLARSGSLDLHRDIVALLDAAPAIDAVAAHALADRLARPDAEDGYHAACAMLREWLERAVIAAAEDISMTEAVAGEARIAAHVTRGRPLDRWVEVWEKLGSLFDRADALKLDRKQVVLDALFMVADAARA